MKKVSAKKAVEMMKKTNGKMFTVDFVKKNGELRKMNCRLGVHQYVKGIGLSFDCEEKGLMPVFDLKVNEYRMVNLKTVKGLRIGGKDYVVG